MQKHLTARLCNSVYVCVYVCVALYGCQMVWIILRLPCPFCGTANHCILLHQSKNSLPYRPSLIFHRPVQNCLFQHKSAPVQAVILTFWEVTRAGTVRIRLLEINPRVSDAHSTTGLFSGSPPHSVELPIIALFCTKARTVFPPSFSNLS